MAYTIIEDFTAGLDLRKMTVTARPGSLRVCENAFINAGGEIEKRKTITAVGTLPVGTVGLGFLNNKVVVFGTAAAPAGALPTGVVYIQIPAASAIDRILDISPFGQGLYIIVRLLVGTVEHYWSAAGGAAVLVPAQDGTASRTHSSKMYLGDGRNLIFSAVNAPSDFAGVGSGAIDLTEQDGSSADVIGMEAYYSYLAVFARYAVQIWKMDPDPDLNTLVQALGAVGLAAPQAVARYGNGDVLFLSDTGIRSLRARDSSNAAVLNDIGSPVDNLVYQLRQNMTPAIAEKIMAVTDPVTGQFWMIWGTTIIVLSYFPNSKVTAWSTYTFPRTIDYAVVANSRLVVRSGDELFVYGSVAPSTIPWDPNAPLGLTQVYDSTRITVELPMFDAGSPATNKLFHGLDVACQGIWDVYVNPDPLAPGAWVRSSTLDSTTYSLQRIPLDMTSTHMGVKLVSEHAGFASFARLALHYDDGTAG